MARRRLRRKSMAVAGGGEADADGETGAKGSNSSTRMAPAAPFVVASAEVGRFGADATFPGRGAPSNDSVDPPGSNSAIALTNENRRSIPALNMLMSLKEFTTIDRSSRTWLRNALDETCKGRK